MEIRRSDFALDREDGGKLLAAYFPVNDPRMPLERLVAFDIARVDVVELGIKAAEPFADGKTVRAAMARAPGQGRVIEAAEAMAAVRGFAHPAFGMIFGYASSSFAAQPTRWRAVDGLLCLGKDDALRDGIKSMARSAGARITEFVPYDLPERATKAALQADAYVMLQYLPGQTGTRRETDASLATRLQKLRDTGIARPILTGIGISAAPQIRHALEAGADGVVIGSRTIEKGLQSQAALEDYLSEMREVLDGS